ncbi:MAG: ribonuclease D [Candidatus Woesearchaeota archaeon]
MDIKFDFINSDKKLIECCKEMKKEAVLGIDLECENNLHYYGIRIALIQISSKTKNYIIDTVALKSIDPFVDILEDEKIIKIFHDVSFDFRMLNYTYKCNCKNIYDTQLAVAFLGKHQTGLGELLEKYFNVKKECKFQMANWVKRPIQEDMLEYAIHDTMHLIDLREILNKELEKENKLTWFEEELKKLETKNWDYHQGVFLDIRGIKQLTNKERAIAFELYNLREKLAEKVNRPIHFILSNKKLIEFSIKPMKNLKQWENITGVHPIVKIKAKEFLTATLKGLEKEYPVEATKRKRYSQKQIEKFTELNEIKEKLSKKFNIPKHLILNKDEEKEIVLNEKLDFLSNWKKELIELELNN